VSSTSPETGRWMHYWSQAGADVLARIRLADVSMIVAKE
jgi:hypothetical protein